MTAIRPKALAPYARVKAALKAGLAAGRWPAGAQMPSEAELMAQFGVSRMTVTRALRELQAEGMVERSQGVGTFAASLHRVASTLTIRDLHEEIESRGHRHRATVHVKREERATRTVAAQLGLRAGDRVFHTLVLHEEDGMPLQCEDRYVNPACAPGYLDVDFTRTTATQYLFEVTALWRAQWAIEAARASTREARLLAIGAGEPCLVIVRSTHSRDAAITVARLVHPGSRYLLEGRFQP
jgi:GntR family histidine utilization transcriptional repressor